MIVCMCANVSERQLDAVIAGGARSVNAVAKHCGAGNGCGDCRGMIRERLRQSRDATRASSAGDLLVAADELVRVA